MATRLDSRALLEAHGDAWCTMTGMPPRTASWTHTIAGAAVAALYPEAKAVSATCWSSSASINAEALAFVRSIIRLDQSLKPVDTYLRAIEALESTDISSDADALAGRVEATSRLLYYRSASAREAGMIEVQRDIPRTSVIIPFRASDDNPLRARNLTAVLSALKHQTLHRDRYRIILVEEATKSGVPPSVMADVDHYIQIPYDGPFNKSQAINRGAAEGVSEGDTLCLLDGDILPDPEFLLRNAHRVLSSPRVAHLPYIDMFCLSADDSEALRIGELATSRPRSGYVITRPPGGCVMLTNTLFQASGGFDERFVGWGGEDREFIDRVSRVTSIEYHEELLIHLYHERPPMRSNRETIMANRASSAKG